MSWRTWEWVVKLVPFAILVVFAAAVALVALVVIRDPFQSDGPSGRPDQELRSDVYEAAVEACSAFPPTAGETAIGAAEEYAAGYQAQFEQAAFEGCLDGFRAAGAVP